MTAEPRHDDILQHLDPSRREFVKGLIAATSFAAPLIASFSLDGLTIESAEAIHFGNQSNQCFAFTEYVGPRDFLATLFSVDATGHHGMAEFKVLGNATALRYRLKLSSGIDIKTARIVMYEDPIDPFPETLHSVLASLVGKKGKLNDADVVSPCTLAFLLQEMAAGFAWIRVDTTEVEVIQGRIVPQGDGDD